MKKVSLLILVSMILLLAFTSCDLIPMSVQTAIGLHKHEWTEATCEAPKTCAGCEATEGEALGHDWAGATCTEPKTCKRCAVTEGEALGHDYAPATCTTAKTCKVCGTTLGKANGHNWNNSTCTEPKTCTDCGTTEGAAKGHTEVTTEENRKEATCTVNGSYDEVVSCSVCKEELSRTKKTIVAIGHQSAEAVKENEVAPKCEVAGSYDSVVYCSVCEEELSRTPITVDPLGHTHAEAVKENDVAPKCEEEGSYDSVVYCSVCNEELSRDTTTVEATGHAPAEAVKENDVAPKCEEEGSYDSVIYCSVCDEELSRVTTTVEATGHDMSEATCTTESICQNGCGKNDGTVDHSPAEAVKENVTEHTCLVDGKYDLAVYCKWCTYEFVDQRQNDVVDPAPGEHSWNAASCDADQVCTVCGEENPDSQLKNHTLAHSVNADGKLTYSCTTCSDNVFTIDGESVYLDGTDNLNPTISGIDQNNHYAPDEVADPEKVDGYYQYIQSSESSTSVKQAQIWIKRYASGFTGMSAANKSVGFLSFKLNLDFAHKDDMLFVMLVESHTLNGDEGYHWSDESGIGSIRSNLFHARAVMTEDVVTGYTITGWRGNVWTIDEVETAEDGSKLSGWIDLKAGIVLDEASDTITVHYYVNGEYWYSASLPLTTSADSITSAYFNLNTYNEGAGIMFDDLAFGYSNTQEWTFDTCEHNYTDVVTAPKCEEGGYTTHTCSLCGYAYVDTYTEATGHTEVVDEAVASTCTKTGLTEGKHCSVCNVVTVAQEVVPVHTAVPGEPTYELISAAKCEEAGSQYEIVHCTECGELYSKTTVEIPATGHTEEVVPGKAASCTTAGLTDGKKCTVCGVTTLPQEEIRATGHTEETVPGYAATCSNAGLTDGVKCSVCGETLKAQGTIPATGEHVYDDDNDATCNNEGCTFERDVTCKHTETVEVPGTEATCTETGLTAGTNCAACGEPVVKQEVIPATGHTEVIDAAVAATCTTPGKTEGKHCSECNETLVAQTEILALGHKPTTLAPKAPTCTESGLTEGSVCSECNETLVAQETIDALGHTWVEASCDAPKTCSVCKETEGEALANHTLACSVVDGVVTYKCTTCADNTFAINNQSYYFDGSTEFTSANTNNSTGNNSYTPDDDCAPEIITVEATGNKYYHYSKSENTTSNTQLQLWVPNYGNNTKFTNFNSGNGSIGVVSFDINVFTDFSGGLVLRLAEGVKSYVDGNGKTQSNWYGSPLGSINDGGKQSAFTVAPVLTAEGVVTGYDVKSWGKTLKTISAEEMDGNFTGWMNVVIGLEMDAANDMLLTHYYMDGKYVLTDCVEITTEFNSIVGVYLNFNSIGEGTGYMLDNLAVGYTNNATWTFDTCEHNYVAGEPVAPTCDVEGYTPHTCSICGHIKRENKVAPTNHSNAPAATCTATSVCPDCNKTVAEALGHDFATTAYNANTKTITYTCTREGCGASCDLTGYYYDGSSNIASFTKNGDFTQTVNQEGGYNEFLLPNVDSMFDASMGDQHMLWIPSATNPAEMRAFSCANNATGFVSFKINAYTTGGIQFKINSERGGDATKGDDYTWDWAYSYALFTIGGVTSDSATTVTIKGLKDAALTTLELAKDADGNYTKWTGWLDVDMIISLTDDGNVTVDYYINDEYVDTHTAAMWAPQRITTVYANGYSSALNSGYMLDEVVFGYTTHYTLDGQEHTITPATCYVPETCSCGWEGTTTNPHNILTTYADSTLTYSCFNCDEEFTIEDGYFMDGTVNDGLNHNGANNKNHGYTTRDDYLPEVNENGQYELIKDASVYAEQGQFQIYVPKSGTHTNLTGFTTANNALGVLSFKVNLKLDTGNVRFILVDVNDKITNGWQSNNQVSPLLTFNKPANGQMTIDAWGSGKIYTVTLDSDGWTGELNVRVIIALSDDGSSEVRYYIDDTLLATTKETWPITSGSLNALYITGNSTADGTGMIIDDLGFGYTPNGHDVFDGQLHNVTSADCKNYATCSTCGWTDNELGYHTGGTVTCSEQAECEVCGEFYGETLEHTGGTATCSAQAVCSVCSLPYGETLEHTEGTAATCYAQAVCSVCSLPYGETLAHNVGTPTYDATTNTLTYSCSNEGCGTSCDMTGVLLDTETSKLNTSDARAQQQQWFPSNLEENLTMYNDFSAANNAYGVLSFRIKAGSEEGLTIALGNARNSALTGNYNSTVWTDWPTSSIDILKFGAISSGSTSVDIYGDLSVGTKLTSVSVSDNFTDWVDVELQMQFSGTLLTINYYINGVHYGEYSADMSDTTLSKRIADGVIQSVYVAGYTTTTGSGWVMDDFVLAYTTHNTLNGIHNITEATNCQTPASCTCDWVGEALPHNFADATCAAPATCNECGATEGEALAHKAITTSVVEGVPTYTCGDCETVYTLSDYYYADGSSYDNLMDAQGATGKLNVTNGYEVDEGKAVKIVTENDDSYYTVIKAAGCAAANTQGQVWVPTSGTGVGLDGFTCANNAFGVLSFEMQAYIDSSSWMQFKLCNDKNTNTWSASINAFKIAAGSNGYANIYGAANENANPIDTTSIAIGTDGWTDWFKVTITIELFDDNTMRLNYFINDTYITSYEGAALIGNAVDELYIQGKYTTENTGFKFDDLAFGYTIPASDESAE